MEEADPQTSDTDPASVEDRAQPARPRVGTLVAVLTTVIVALLPYVTRLSGKGFALDDRRFIIDNPHVAPLQSFGEFFARFQAFLTDPSTVDPLSPTGIVRPLRTLEFAIDRSLFGLDPTAFAVHNALWHALAAVFVLLLLRKWIKIPLAALFGALVFAVHPLHVEAVAFISSRGDVAMGACVLGSLYAFARSRGAPGSASPRRGWLVASLVLGAVAMLYKEAAVILPLLIVAVHWTLPSSPASATSAQSARPWRRGLLAALPWFALSAAYLLYRQAVVIGDVAHVDTHVLGGSTAGTFATMFRGFGYYLSSLFVPGTSSVDWYLPVSTTLLDAVALAWLAVHVGCLGWAFTHARGSPRAAAAIVFLYAPLLPVANWPFALGIPTADRFAYLSVCGVALLAALLAERCVRTRSQATSPAAPAAVVAGLVVVASLFASTWQRTPLWQNDDTLWPGTLAIHESPRALGYACAESLRLGLHLRQRATKAPSTAEADRLQAEADERLRQGLREAHLAIDLWLRIESVERSDSFVMLEPQSNAANLCLLLGEPDHGVIHAREAVRIGRHELADETRAPPQPAYNLAWLLLRIERPVQALRAMQLSYRQGMRLQQGEGRRFFSTLLQQLRDQGSYELARQAADALSGVLAEPLWLSQFQNVLREYETKLRAESLAGDTDAGARLALFLAGSDRVDEARALRRSLPEGSIDEIAWIEHVHEARGTATGWAAAVTAYEYVTSDPAHAAYRQAVCEEALLHEDRALAAVETALQLAAETDAAAPSWRADAERMRSRLVTGCPHVGRR